MVRAALALLSLSGCHIIFNLEDRVDASVLGEAGADGAPLVDAATADAPTDVPLLLCPLSYAISGRYRLSPSTDNFIGAAKDCADDAESGAFLGRSHLAVAGSTQEYVMLASIGGGQSPWIGLTRLNTAPNYRWVSVETVPIPVSQPPWAQGAPDPSQSMAESCVVIRTGSLIEDIQCASLQLYICECDEFAPDPSSWE